MAQQRPISEHFSQMTNFETILKFQEFQDNWDPCKCTSWMPKVKPRVCLVLNLLIISFSKVKMQNNVERDVKNNLIKIQFDCIQLFQSCIQQQMWFLTNSQWLMTKQWQRHVTYKRPRWQQVVHLNKCNMITGTSLTDSRQESWW